MMVVVKRLSSNGPIFLVLLAVSLVTSSCRGSNPEPVASVSIGTTASEVNLLILVAEDRGYFAGHGLSVTTKIYASGVAALEGLANHEVDLATGSEFAFVGQILSHRDVRTIGSVSRSSIEYLVGRVDRGVESLADLAGKTIGVPLKSRPEFALDRFLYLRGLDASEVTLANVPVDKSVAALVSGQVDAVASWQPYIDQIKEQMGDRVVTWSVQEDQPSYTLVMSEAGWADENRQVITRLLESLVEAERYVDGNPDAAKALMQQKLSYDRAYVDGVWSDYRFSVSLDQALVVAMEDQARWIIGNHLTGESQVPNFVSYTYLDGLEAVKPEAVSIIR